MRVAAQPPISEHAWHPCSPGDADQAVSLGGCQHDALCTGEERQEVPQSSVLVPGCNIPSLPQQGKKLACLQQLVPCSEKMVPLTLDMQRETARTFVVAPLPSQCPWSAEASRISSGPMVRRTVRGRRRPGSGPALQGLPLSHLLYARLMI